MKETNGDSAIAFVIFGVTGDLAHRKLLPALYELCREDRLLSPLTIVGFARRDWTDEKLREEMRACVEKHARTRPLDEEALERLLQSMFYVQSTFEDTQGYRRLAQKLDELQLANRLYYLASPPTEYSNIVRNLGEAGLGEQEKGWTRLVVEKPYGRDLASAAELDDEVHRVFKEEQVYRIDHYLGKETVQNILVFRFANGIFEPLWNRRYVDHIQITVAESIGIGTRAGYYEQAGVIRDMFQNHIMQLLALVAMEAPTGFHAEAVRNEKVKVLQALRPLRGQEALENTYRAQYVAGQVDGERAPGYKDEQGVAPDSLTETLMAARLFVDNWRWAGVPFYIRSGKRLPQRLTTIAIQFKQVPLSLFGWQNLAGSAPNRIVINIQPEEGIILTFGAKAPGPIDQIRPVQMNFDYVETFGEEPPEAYERLLLDSIQGDATLFTRSDEIRAAWAFTTDVLNSWNSQPLRNLPVYEAGTWGPAGIEDFIQMDDRKWCLLTKQKED